MCEMVEKRRKEYEKLSKQPLKIIFKMKNEICLNDYLMLDSLLAYAVLKDVWGDNFENNTNSDNLIDVPLPLKRTDEVWHASAGIFEIAAKDKASWKKRFDDENSHLVDKEKKRSGKYGLKIDVGSRNMKAYSMPVQLYLTREIFFYANGHAGEIQKLLEKHIHSAGKKRSQGYGFINEIIVKAIDHDYSFFDEKNRVCRPITQEILNKELENRGNMSLDINFRYMPVKPPYWNAKESVKCIATKFINIIGD